MVAALHIASHKTLGDLLPDLVAPQAALPVVGLAIDSRCLRAGEIFLAYPGAHVDGRLFVDQAVARGATAIIAESGFERSDLSIPVIRIPKLREQVSAIADRFYAQPTAAMSVIGVTGTNGKTSCTQLLAQALRILDKPCGVIGTLGNSLASNIDTKSGGGPAISGGGLTTPDPVALQAQFAQWRDQGVRYAAMEVSSHGLAQARVNAIRFCGAVFTNLTRDHLDFHGTMAAYGAAKARLFAMPGLEFAVINRDDAYGAELIDRVQEHVRVLDYSMHGKSALTLASAEFHSHGVRATVQTPWGEIALRSHLLGDFNLSNLLAVIGVLGQLQVPTTAIAEVLPQLDPIAGRMQRVVADADIEVVVDYAHTPDALEHALGALRQHCRGQLWCVFGCGGDRDAGKRPLMGEVAAHFADRIVLTNDNPRSENPQSILEAIGAGIGAADTEKRVLESDRAAAISLAIRHAQSGDMILLAGKGHEDYQLIGSEIRPFNDVMVARAALLARAADAAGGIE